LERGADEDVRSTTTLTGFDPEAEPILRDMRDGSLLLVFGFIPPLVTESDAGKAKGFDINKFGEDVGAAAGVPVIWDDRDVFVVQKPNADTADRLRHFLANYWERSTKRWWQLW
jgi:hypothetical protein